MTKTTQIDLGIYKDITGREALYIWDTARYPTHGAVLIEWYADGLSPQEVIYRIIFVDALPKFPWPDNWPPGFAKVGAEVVGVGMPFSHFLPCEVVKKIPSSVQQER